MIVITGTYPPERCGVGDYTQHLFGTTASRTWTLFYRRDWSWRQLRTYVRELREIDDPVVNLQYPTMGYVESLVPHALVILAVLLQRKRLYITTHEYSQFGWKGRLALNFLFLFAQEVLFTTSFELACARRHNPWMRKGQVLKIRSNIPAATSKPIAERRWDVGYFGYIRPLKGIEEFIRVTEVLHQQGKRVYVMGQVQPDFAAYHEPLLQQLRQCGIAYFGDKSQQEVAEILADTKIMYLPYPDGLSERRGSFLAAVVNGAVVVSKEGAFTSQQQKETFSLVSDKGALEKIAQGLNDEVWLKKQQQQSLLYAEQSVPASWEQIAEEYNRIMQ